MNCPKCGNLVSPNVAFCRFCGMCLGVQAAPAGKNCPTCGTMLSAQAKFCSKCGTRMDGQPKPLICASCGAQLPSGSLFCNKCGGRVDQTPKASLCRGCGAQLAPDFLFCNLCGTPCAGAPGTAQKDEKTEPVPPSAPEPLLNTKTVTMPEPEIVSVNDVSETEPVVVLSSDPVIEPEEKPIVEAEPQSAVMMTPDPVPEPITDMEAASLELGVEEAPAKEIVADICPACGKERIPGMAFCINCGARLRQDDESTAVSAPEPVSEIEPKPEPDITATPMQELAFEEVSAPAPSPVADACPICGKERIPGMAFCINCGARLPQSEPAAVSTPEPEQGIEFKPEPDITATPMQELAFEEVSAPAPSPVADTCPTCGKERIPGMAFCTGCGTRLIQQEPVSAMPVIAPVPASAVPPMESSAKPFVIERIQMPEPEPEQPAPAWQSVCAACGMVVASGLRNCPRCGAKV